ncbi:MAG: Uma2 family endonuclease [Bacteroidetes bacterium]|nr:MAG: Uma2 family endonuclease [Bacteroidota bacterium]
MRAHPLLEQSTLHYPSSDGKPLADNTLQLRWIVYLYSNLLWWFRDQKVFIAADLLWYPVEGEPRNAKAPDVMVAFDRPAGDRLSYKQWEEAGVAPQVVFEILSASNGALEMLEKQQWYARYGVQEFIIIDPEANRFVPMLRVGEHLVQADFSPESWQSPHLGIWLRRQEGELNVFFADDTPFKTLTESQLEAEAQRKRAEAAEAELERLRQQLREQGS